jgi:hypothetical protein
VLVGHVSLAFLARARWPRASLVALVGATMLPDLADFALPPGDRCRASCVLYTHAFPAVIVLAVVAAAFAWGIWHRRAVAGLAATMVISHVLLDFITGYKPFWVGGPPIGLLLYNRESVDFVIESVMMVVAWLVLRRQPGAPRVAISWYTLVALVILQGAFDAWLYSVHQR